LPSVKVTTLIRISPDGELVIIPELSREVEEDLGISSHMETIDTFEFPSRESRAPFNVVVLKDTDTESRDGIVGMDSIALVSVDNDTLLVVFDLGNLGIEQ
jgi:hypothetical protein